MKKIYRQGDIALIPVKEFPANLNEKDKVIAVGESTNHSHRFESEQVSVFTDGKQQFVNVKSPSRLIHEEHHELEIPSGKYKVVLQKEFDISQQVRQVLD